MRRRAAPLRRRASVHAAVVRTVAASLTAALVTVLGITSAVALGVARSAGSDPVGVRAATAPAALSGVAGSLPSTGLGAHGRGAAPDRTLWAAAEQDDADDDRLVPPGADGPQRVRTAGPTAPGARPAAGAPRASTGVAATVHGRAPPA